MSTLLDWGIPELIGLSYALFAAIAFVGIQERNIVFLTPQSTSAKIVSTMRELLFLTNDKGVIIFANEAARHSLGPTRLLGLQISTVLGTSMIEPEAFVSLGRRGPSTQLSFCDLGKGMGTANSSDHRGLAIVSALCDQIGTELVLTSGLDSTSRQGTAWSLVIPPCAPEPADHGYTSSGPEVAQRHRQERRT